MEDLRKGGHLFVEHLYGKEREACLKRMVRNTSCTRSEAEDWFMEALLVVRKKALQGVLASGDLGGYLYTCCYRFFLASRKKAQFLVSNVRATDMENTLVDSDLSMEAVAEFERRFKHQFDLYEKAWKQMDEKCRSLLKAFYLDGVKLIDLQKSFGLGSYDSMKTTKKRCLQKLKGLVAA